MKTKKYLKNGGVNIIKGNCEGERSSAHAEFKVTVWTNLKTNGTEMLKS